MSLDPVTFEVIRHRLWAINDDQARMAARLSGAPIVFEGYDFNAALVTGDGQGLCCGLYILQHGATIDEFVRLVLGEWGTEGIKPGDMFFTNDPWCGALHANDGILAMPIFWEDRIVAWSGIVMHDNDVGSPVPGSMVKTAADRFGESPLFPTVKMVEDFELRHDLERLYLRNSRSPALNALNMRARVGAMRVAHDRIRALIEKYGVEAFLATQEGILEYVERVVRRRLSELPDGSWFAQGYLDHDGNTDAVYPIRCRLTKRGERLTVDFTGTAPQAPGPINCTRPALDGTVFGVLLTFLCYDLPWAIGGLRGVVDIISEEGTLNNALSPAAVSTASVSATLSTQDVLAHAFAKMLLSSEAYRGEAQATWMPGFSGGFFTAPLEGGELGLITIADVFGGGGGARTFTDGIDSGGILHSMASRMCNVETIESRAPVLQVYRRELRDAGGPGRYRGGVGIEFGGLPHRLAGPGMFMTFASGVAMPGGRGLSGGSPGGAASSVIHRGSDVREQFAAGRVPIGGDELGAETVEVQEAKAITMMGEGDLLVSIVASGAGYGDPTRREPDAVARDVAEGLVSPALAASAYGVLLDAAGAVDAAATDAARLAIRRERLAQGRLLDGATPGARVEGGRVLHPVADTIEAVELDGGERAFRCTDCGQRLGGYDEDYKQATSVRELALETLSPVNHRCSPDYVAREFACPGCGTAIAVDVQARDEPILDEARFFS